MAGLFAHMAAGAAQGLGNSIVEQGKAKRDAQLRLLEMEQRFGYERSLLEERNKFTAAENEKDRASRSDLIQGSDGAYWSRSGDKAVPVLGPEGQQLAGKPKDISAPEVKEIFDNETGRKRMVQWDPSSQDWKMLGGVEGSDPAGDMDAEQKLRKEYAGTAQFKRFDEVRASYERVKASAKADSGPGDLGLIFGFMKMLDPGSVVREGEFANAENAQGVPDKIRNTYNRIVEGERLAPNQRQRFVSLAGDLYRTEAEKAQALNQQFSTIAEQYGVEPSRVITPIPEFEDDEPADRTQDRVKAGAPALGAVEDGFEFLGGDPADPKSWRPVS